MFSLTIVFGPSSTVWTLMFKTEESSQNCITIIGSDNATSMTVLADDFGQKCTLRTSEIHGWMIENLEQSKLARIEMELHAVRTKLKANEIADADPMIRQARARQQGGGMPMLQPMGAIPGLQNGRFPS